MDEAAVLALHAWVVSQEIVAQSVSLIAQYGIFVLPAAFAVLCFAHPSDLRTKRAVLLAGALSFILALLLSFGIGLVLDRPRPVVALGIPPLFPYPADSSFPSDHTLLGIAPGARLLGRDEARRRDHEERDPDRDHPASRAHFRPKVGRRSWSWKRSCQSGAKSGLTAL